MADQITNYKCPACTGPLHFVGASGKLECDYCGSSYSVEEIEAIVRGETELDAALSARIMAIQKEKAALDRAGEIAGRLRQAHAQFRTLDARPYLDEMQTERVLERDTLPKEHFPWQRFFARLLDGQIYRTLWMLLLPALGFNMLKNSRGGMLFLELLTLGTMFLLEPLLLSRFGTTPGKWLFGLRVTSPDGRKLTYAEGLPAGRTTAARRIAPGLAEPALGAVARPLGSPRRTPVRLPGIRSRKERPAPGADRGRPRPEAIANPTPAAARRSPPPRTATPAESGIPAKQGAVFCFPGINAYLWPRKRLGGPPVERRTE